MTEPLPTPRPRQIQTHDNDVTASDLEPRHPIHVVCDNLRSAYNVGSFFRTGDAARIAGLHLCGITAHPPSEKLAKTALGTSAVVPWWYYANTTEALDHLRNKGIWLVGVEQTDRSQPLWSMTLTPPLAFVFGHEVHGISDEVLTRCDALLSLPMHGLKNSLNVATAVGIVLYEALRQLETMNACPRS
jgi:tRNA G18 (ribose-2'-O)-methylase SpoU